MATLFAVGIEGLILVIIITLLLLMPSLTRRDILFGATVPPNTRETTEGKAIIRRYRLSILVIGVAAALGLWALWTLAPVNFWESLRIIFVPLVIVLLPQIPYLLAWRSARELAGASPASASPGASATLRLRRYADYIPLVWEALPLALIALTASYLAITYADAPRIIPTHFGTAGTPDVYSIKSIGSYFFVVWTQLFLYTLLTFLSVLTIRAKAQATVADETFRRRTIRYLFGIKALMIALMGALGYATAQSALTAHANIGWILWLALGVVAVVLVGAIWLAVSTGQGGSRLAGATGNGQNATDRMDDRYWKLGGIYANPNDPAIFVERRFGLGWTINWGNPRGVLLFVAILALPLAFAAFAFAVMGR